MCRSRDCRCWCTIQRIDLAKITIDFIVNFKIGLTLVPTTIGAVFSVLFGTGTIEPLITMSALHVVLMSLHVIAERCLRRKKLELITLWAIRTIKSAVRVQAMAFHVASGLECRDTARCVDAFVDRHGAKWLGSGFLTWESLVG